MNVVADKDTVPARRFGGRVVIITGGASGIGLATGLQFAREGAIVAIADLDPARLEAARTAIIAAGAPAVTVRHCDVGAEDEAGAFVDAVLQAHGRLDIVVNSAGMMIFRTIVEMTGADWSKVLGVDLLGAVHFTRQAFLRMQDGGAIVNVSSVHAIETTPLVAAYAAAKAALLSFTRSSAIEGKSKNIRVNAVLPGAIDTPMLWSNPNIASGAERIEPADVGKPADVAAAIAFLASPEARFITGACLNVDGGRLATL